MASSEIYACSEGGPIRQGEVLFDVVQVRLKVEMERRFPKGIDEEHRILRVEHPFAIVVSQDCDLDWDYKARTRAIEEHKLLPNVLFCEVAPAEDLRLQSGINSTIWARIKINKDERYHFLEIVPADRDAAGEGLPELAMDFKRCFSVPTDEVYWQLNSKARRRSRLATPYVEHLCDRLFHFHARIALPAEHFSVPVSAKEKLPPGKPPST